MDPSKAKPCTRVMRAPPHETDQHQKEVNCYLLQALDEEHRISEEEAHIKEEQQGTANDKLLSCDNDDDTSSSLFSDKSSDQPSYQELPTFIAHQGYAPLQLQRKDEWKRGTRWFKRSEQQQQLTTADKQQLFRPLFPKDCCSSALPQAVWTPSKPQRHSNILRFFGNKECKYLAGEQGHHARQRSTLQEERCCAHGPAFACSRHRAASVREELGAEKRRNSSASFEDVLRFREGMSKQKPCDMKTPSSWEEEVRQAMARNLVMRNEGDEAFGLQRSLSMRDHTSSLLPATLLMKASGAITSNLGSLEPASRPNEIPLQRKDFYEKHVGCGMNVKSPSEERWEEAAEVEEQEFQRRTRSQSMRYDALQAADVRHGGRPWEFCGSENASDEGHGWAVYKKTGYINVQPPAVPGTACCNSMAGRSFSMRDTRMGLVMECAGCGRDLHDVSGRLLCVCSCCAENRGCSAREGMEASAKKKSGLLRACRKLLGLGKKRAAMSPRHRFDALHK